MAQPYSLDLRCRAVTSGQRGSDPSGGAATFPGGAFHAGAVGSVLIGPVGSLEPKKGKPGFAGQFEHGCPPWHVCTASSKHIPIDRLLDHCRRWQKATGKSVSEPTMWRAWQRLGSTYKKRDTRPPASATRANGRLGHERHAGLSPGRLVFRGRE